MKIPLSAAIALLQQATDVLIDGMDQTTSFQFDPAEDAFLVLVGREHDCTYDWEFSKDANKEIEIDGDWMILLPDPSEDDPDPAHVRIRLLTVLKLTRLPAWPLKVTRWIRKGELGLPDEDCDTDDILEGAGRILDNNCVSDNFGDVVFEASDGRTYVGNAEFVLSECDPDYLQQLEEDEDKEDEEQLYSIIRFYHHSTGKEREVLHTDLTLAEAKEHCADPDNQREGKYFDGFEKE